MYSQEYGMLTEKYAAERREDTLRSTFGKFFYTRSYHNMHGLCYEHNCNHTIKITCFHFTLHNFDVLRQLIQYLRTPNTKPPAPNSTTCDLPQTSFMNNNTRLCFFESTASCASLWVCYILPVICYIGHWITY